MSPVGKEDIENNNPFYGAKYSPSSQEGGNSACGGNNDEKFPLKKKLLRIGGVNSILHNPGRNPIITEVALSNFSESTLKWIYFSKGIFKMPFIFLRETLKSDCKRNCTIWARTKLIKSPNGKSWLNQAPIKKIKRTKMEVRLSSLYFYSRPALSGKLEYWKFNLDPFCEHCDAKCFPITK